MSRALGSAAFVLLVVGAAVAYALRLPQPDEGAHLLPRLALPYVALAAIGAWRLRRDEAWRASLRFRAGDPTIGILLGLFLVLAAWVLGKVLLPLEALQHAWVLRIFLMVGDTSTPLTLFWLILLAVAEELVWRGWVQSELSRAFGPRRGWALGALFYAAAYLPTLVTLADAAAGYNPLLVLASLGCGLCWAFSRERTGRLLPSIFSHAAFSYLASQFLWRIL
jgi:membrane protease YdiL (CAAX protease family)